MRKCNSCQTYSPDHVDYCEFCGEYFHKKTIIDIFHSSKINERELVFPFEKNKQLCNKIDQEIQRVNDIQNLLVNIKSATIKDRINDIVKKINGYIDSLVKCRCDIEFIKISGLLNALLSDSRKIGSEEILKYENDFKQELLDAFDEIQESYDRKYLDPYFEDKRKEFEKMIENMSVLLISSILSKTSIVKELEYSSETNYKNLEENIDKINYEIDRLSAELSM